MTGLRIAEGFELPLDVAVESSGFLGKKGSGKSNGLVVLAEEMQRAGVPWVAVDPKGDWWGVRSSADGTKPGLPIVVFGGKHGDVPLEPTAGGLVADLIVGDEDRGYLTCVLDVSQFIISDQRRFLRDFGQQLFRRKDETNVLHLFLEEAHEYLPQKVDDTTLVSTWQRIVKQGRFKGLGVTLASQRSAAVNKDVLTQVDSLFAMRVLSPQDRAAVNEWVKVNATSRDVVGTLHELAPGECWLWSPERFADPVRFRFRQRWTFDSGATPKVGETRRTPRTLADVDLGVVKEQMADTIERAKADDPKELRKRIRELERDLTQARVEQPAPEVIEVPVLDAAALLTVEEVIKRWDRAYDDAAETVNTLRDALARVEGPTRDRPDVPRTRPASSRPAPVERQGPPQRPDPPDQRAARRPPVPRTTPATGVDATRVGKGERVLLAAIAQHNAGVTPEQLTVLTGYKRSSRNTYLQRLRSAGLVESDAGRIVVTDAGLDEIGDDYERLPTGAALREYWLGKLPEGEGVLLAELIDAHPTGVARDELGERTGYKRSSRNTYIQRLRARELITVSGGVVIAADVLFEGGTR